MSDEVNEIEQSGSVEENGTTNSRFNIVTTDRVRAKITRAIAETGTIPVISYLAFGDGGLGQDGQPISPDPTANALNHELFRLPIEDVDYLTPYNADLTVSLASAAYNDTPITEFGAVDEDGDFVGFQTFKTVTKQDILNLLFHWYVEF